MRSQPNPLQSGHCFHSVAVLIVFPSRLSFARGTSLTPVLSHVGHCGCRPSPFLGQGTRASTHHQNHSG